MGRSIPLEPDSLLSSGCIRPRHRDEDLLRRGVTIRRYAFLGCHERPVRNVSGLAGKQRPETNAEKYTNPFSIAKRSTKTRGRMLALLARGGEGGSVWQR